MMKPVVQLEPTGCGIASVAAIAGLSYARTKAIASSLNISAQDERLWSGTDHVRKLLNHLGVKTDERGARVLDSKKSLRRHVRTDFGRIEPKWFIPIVDARVRLELQR